MKRSESYEHIGKEFKFLSVLTYHYWQSNMKLTIQHYNADMTTNQLRHITNSRICKINHCIRECEMFWNLTIHIGTNMRGFQICQQFQKFTWHSQYQLNLIKTYKVINKIIFIHPQKILNYLSLLWKIDVTKSLSHKEGISEQKIDWENILHRSISQLIKI